MANNQPPPYRYAVIVGAAGVVMLVLGFTIPGLGWIAWVGLIVTIPAAFLIRIRFVGDWIPTLFGPKERDKENNLPPPPTVERPL
ncbi:MAG TPA: hypothetical protein VGN15_00390 [Ktedonobacteraceae bacterium]|nr:hypothetical protein [Ktedonobacteraceae bacterium]